VTPVQKVLQLMQGMLEKGKKSKARGTGCLCFEISVLF